MQAMPCIDVIINGVFKLLQSINPSKASGPDDIPEKVSKGCAQVLAPWVADFFQQSSEQSSFPDDWKT